MTAKSRIRRAGAIASLLIGVAVSFAAQPAEADELACTVTGVELRIKYSMPELLIRCDGFIAILYANPTDPSFAPCGADFGAIKAMATEAIASRLTGAPLLIGYTANVTCGTGTMSGTYPAVLVNTDL